MQPTHSASSNWSRPLRLIHLLLAIAVTLQLFVGSFMRSPHPGRVDSTGFVVHEILGATILVLVAAHWIWSCTHRGEGLRHLFPWSRTRLHEVLDDLLSSIRVRRLHAGGPSTHGSLAGFVHGLGLLTITAMVIIGGAFYLARLAGMSFGHLDLIEDVHDTFAVILWVYWGGHLAATVLHSLLGQPVWRSMFNLRHPATSHTTDTLPNT
ncbi:MAG TPA: cytochrome b/b6 domain-containing protein [Rhodanobacteraceae bacterium]